MARIDDLLRRVAEPGLRKEMAAAVKELRQRREFGLVFEEHVPEVLAQPGLPLRARGLAYRTDDSSAELLQVLQIGNGIATVVPLDKTRTRPPPPRRKFLRTL